MHGVRHGAIGRCSPRVIGGRERHAHEQAADDEGGLLTVWRKTHEWGACNGRPDLGSVLSIDLRPLRHGLCQILFADRIFQG